MSEHPSTALGSEVEAHFPTEKDFSLSYNRCEGCGSI
jgi:hypothetical protein